MARFLLKDDPVSGIKVAIEDTVDGPILRTYQDVESILDDNKRKQNSNYYRADDDYWRVAQIPINIMYEWLTKFGVDALEPDDWPRVKKLLNDPDYRYLKCADIII